MATHLIVMSLVMEDMDGTPEQSAEILVTDTNVLLDYLNAGAIEVTYEDISDEDV